MKDVDEFVELLGKPNRYSALVIFLLCFMYFPISFNHLVMAVYGAVPPHRCHIPDDVSLNDSIPMLENGEYDSCQVYVNYTQESGKTEPCPNGWRYEVTEGETTIVTEWDLVCDRFYLGPLSTSIYFICNMIGALCLGTISDRLGRKTIMLTVIYLHIVFGVMVYFVESFTLFVILRGLIGFCVVGADNSIIIAMEWVRGSRGRTNINSVFQMFWASGVVTLGLVSYGLRNWRNIQLAITLPCLFSIGYVWCVPESVRWLLTRGHLLEAEKCLIRGAKFNRIQLPADALDIRCHHKQNATSDHDQPKYTLFDLFKHRNIRKRILIMSYAWLATGLVYYGLSLNASAIIPGNKYISFIVSGLVELPPVLLGFYFLQRFGRKRVLIFYGLTSGVVCIVAGFIPHTTSNGVDLTTLASSLAWLGKLCSNGCWNVIVLYCTELFPTSLRNMAVLYCDCWARIGSVVATQIAIVAVYTAQWVPPGILGCSALIMGGVVFLLPETLNKQFPDAITEVERPDKKMYILTTNTSDIPVEELNSNSARL